MSEHQSQDTAIRGAALAAAPALAANSAATADGKKVTYVLVHGGGHGGWCWERVATPLRAQGHRVYTPTLTGLGERSHLLSPDINLDTHITDVVNGLRWENLTGVILVGHSYGGMVITGVADRAPDRVGQLVYLDAAHPKNGQSLAEIAMSGLRSTVRVVNGVELGIFPDVQLVKGPLGVTDPKDVAWMMDKLTPQPWKTIEQPLNLQNEAALKKIPTTDIWRAMILKQLDPDGSKRKTMADRVWEIDSPSHNLMITEPKAVTDMLLRLAAI